MNSAAVAFHFLVTFLVSIASLGGAAVASRRAFVVPGKVARLLFGLGWILVALGETLHATAITGTEPAPLAVAIRFFGYFLVTASLLVSFKKPLPGSALLSAGIALWVLSEILFVVIKGLHGGPPTLYWALVHALRLVGGVVVLVWLWRAVRTSIQARFVAIFIVMLLVVVVTISTAMTQLFASNIAAESLNRATREADIQKRLLDAQVAESVSRARQVSELDSVRRAVAERDPVLAGTVTRLQAPGGPFDSSDFMSFLAADGSLLALSAAGLNGAKNLDSSDALSIAGAPVVRSALAGRQAGSVDVVGAAKLGLIGAYPIFRPPGFDPPGRPQGLAGAVVLGRLIDRKYVAALARGNGQQAFLITNKTVLIRTAGDVEGVLPNEAQKRRIFEEAMVASASGRIGGVDYFSSYIPLLRADQRVIGALVLSQRSRVLETTQAQAARTIFLLALTATAAGVALSYVSGARITQPLRELTLAAESIRSGDLTTRVKPKGADEVAVLASAFDQMTLSLAKLTEDLRTSAENEFGLRSRLETILQSMTDGVVAIDDAGLVVAFNREVARILGIAPDDANGRNIREILVVSDGSGSPISLPIYNLESSALTGEIAGRNGKPPTPVGVTSAPITDESGAVIGAVAVVRDLSQEMEIENMKTTFLSNVSHELRTPLTPIKGYADLMRRKEIPRIKRLAFLDGIIASADKLERIVDMLVAFSAMEAGRLVPNRVPLDLGQVTADIVGKWAAEAPGHAFHRKGFAKLPPVSLDRKLVPSAIDELIENAVKFSPQGGKIDVGAELDPPNRRSGELRIWVEDRGIGIEKDQLASIADNFAQIDESSTRAYGGLGLGLAYVRRIVESHGGRMQVQSAPGKGSRFTLVFPVTEAHLSPAKGRTKKRP